MLSIAIDRVTARYHLPPTAAREQPRVQRVLDDALARVLESTIERHGIGREGYVCIGDVHAVINLRLREPDSALATNAGEAIAAAIRRLIDDRSPLVVAYGSRVQALVDLASSALSGDFTRSWAWAQVGIWRTDVPISAGRTADLILRALADEPAHAVAVAAHLAREQKDKFRSLVAGATPKAWAALATAAMRAAAGSGGARRAPETPAVVQLTDATGGRRALATVARRIVSVSAIARTAIERSGRDAVQIRAALAALILLEAEPSAAARGHLPRLLTAIEEIIAVAPPLYRAHSGDLRHLSVAGGDGSAVSARPRENDDLATRVSDEPVTRHDDQDACQAGPPGDADGSTAPAEALAEALPNVRTVWRTQWGGVLYLVNLLTRTGLVETIAADPSWSARGVRWVLQQLAMSIAAIEPEDAAALVFAGLAPGNSPPSALQNPPTERERAALDTLRDVLVEALRDVLGESADRHTLSDVALVAGVCRRPAQIVAEPGWVEAHFSLEDVSLDIRRVGLDRNPDWVPWLGIVLRFVYA